MADIISGEKIHESIKVASHKRLHHSLPAFVKISSQLQSWEINVFYDPFIDVDIRFLPLGCWILDTTQLPIFRMSCWHGHFTMYIKCALSLAASLL